MVFYIARLVKSKRFCAKDFNIIMLEQIKDLITYANEKLNPSSRDGEYKANRLLEIMQSGNGVAV